jgi:hypothetical protein
MVDVIRTIASVGLLDRRIGYLFNTYRPISLPRQCYMSAFLGGPEIRRSFDAIRFGRNK